MADKRYTRTHEWCQVDGGVATCGITKHAAEELGDLTFLDFRVSAGATIEQGDVFGELDSVKATSELFSPVSGAVEAVNEKFGDADQLSTLSNAPETEGWIMKVKLSEPGEVAKLMTRADYDAFCAAGAGH